MGEIMLPKGQGRMTHSAIFQRHSIEAQLKAMLMNYMELFLGANHHVTLAESKMFVFYLHF
jgi:hypothetical protein